MATVVSRSKFKPGSLEYFRKVETSGEELIITEPVGAEDWESSR